MSPSKALQKHLSINTTPEEFSLFGYINEKGAPQHMVKKTFLEFCFDIWKGAPRNCGVMPWLQPDQSQYPSYVVIHPVSTPCPLSTPPYTSPTPPYTSPSTTMHSPSIVTQTSSTPTRIQDPPNHQPL
ncbi:hypothetical protein F5051DRAFT_447315 [Lentinula edodes]|nr:hypothetical protein F5051DRAFT_447315 [Lentinula edodes]